MASHSVSKSKFNLRPAIRGPLVVGLIYIFLVGVSALSKGINVGWGEGAEKLFEAVDNPLAGLFVGILATVMVQSSSATTSVIVGLVASGALGVDAAVPMVMGANIGTSVTNTLVSLGHLREGSEFRRAFAAATVHDFFNVLSVIVLLPLELATGILSKIARAISSTLVGTSGSEWKSPVKAAVKGPVGWIKDIWHGFGLTGAWLGTAMILTGLLIILVALTFITKNMRVLVAARMERSLNAILGKGGGLVAMALGLVITVAVQSSSITTSILVPMAAAGVLTIRSIYPVTLGANVGTTITALLAALAASSPDALTIALVHTTFNVVGIMILYGIPPLRGIPIRLAEGLAELAVVRKAWALAYVVGMFIIVPLVGIALLR